MSALRRKPPLTLDIGPLFEARWAGVAVYTRRLVQALVMNGELELSFAYNLARIPEVRVFEAIRIGAGAYLADECASGAEKEPELADPGAPVLYPGAKGRCSGLIAREASTVHDMTALFMPDAHDEDAIAHHLDPLEAELRTDEAIFCVSEATRASLIAAAPSVAQRIRLIPPYIDWPESFELTERNLPTPRPRPYALAMGSIAPRDNLGLLIEALDEPEVAKLDLAFVVLGERGGLVDEFLARLTPQQRERVIFSGLVSEFVKYRLIKGAEFLIFPSLCEGFGVPALEAMSLGKPVLASFAAALPEVIGDAGVYFDPISTSDFASALAEIANPLKLGELAPRALRRNAEFTPERMAAPVVAWAKL